MIRKENIKMDNELTYLTINQGFALVDKISELKENPYFKDAIAESFVEEVYTRAAEITVNSINSRTNILQKLRKNGSKIIIPKSKFEYITRLTGIDVFDEEIMNKFTSKLDGVDLNIQTEKANLIKK